MAMTLRLGGQTRIDLRSQAKHPDLSGMGATLPFQTGTTLPATCRAGESYFKTDASVGENVYVCQSQDQWVLIGGLPATGGNAGKVLKVGAGGAAWVPLGGDVEGIADVVTVKALQGKSVAAAAPADGNVLKWDMNEEAWKPSGAGIPNYSGSFTAQQEVLISGSDHALESTNLVVECYDNGIPARKIEPDSISVDPVTRNVRVAFAVAQSGRCVVNGSGGSGGGGAGSVLKTEVISGTGLVSSSAGQTTTVQVNTAVVPTFVSAAALAMLGPIAAGACVETNLDVTGAAVGDGVAAGWPASLPATLIGSMRVSAADVVSIRLCNLGSGTVPAWTDTYRATITRSF